MKRTYHKLVRDRIPQIIRAGGGSCKTRTLEPGEYMALLEEKLSEELAEYQESKSLEELADLLEVMEAVVCARGSTWQELIAIKEAKKARRGGFEKRILLTEVTQKEKA